MLKNKQILSVSICILAALVLIILILIKIFGFQAISQKTKTLLSQGRNGILTKTKEIPAPYNEFNYSYTGFKVNLTSPTTLPLPWFSYVNNSLVQTTFTKTVIFSDGNGFYQINNPPTNCGGSMLGSSTNMDFARQECIIANGKSYIVNDDPYFVNKNYIIYEQCIKMDFYPSMNENDCSSYALKVNDKVIDTSSGGWDQVYNEKSSAPKFSDIEVDGNTLSYAKSIETSGSVLGRDVFVTYDLVSGNEKIQYSSPDNSPFAHAQLVDGNPEILSSSYPDFNQEIFNKITDKLEKQKYYFDTLTSNNTLILPNGEKLDSVDAFAAHNGHQYLLEKNNIATSQNNLPSTVLLKDGLGALEFTPTDPDQRINIYPNCDNHSTVCLYNNGDYLAERRYKADDTTPSPYPFSTGYSHASLFVEPTTYYPNGIDTGYVFEDSDLPFVFSSNGDTYMVYYIDNTIYGVDITAATSPIKLFQLDSADTIKQLRVFPK